MKRMDGAASEFTDTDTKADQEAAHAASRAPLKPLYSPAFGAVALIVSSIVVFASVAHIVATLIQAANCPA